MLSVSVLVNTFNSESTIERTLDSILKSKYKEFNIIISDDASTDGTINILSRYEKIYSNILILTSKKNLGILKNCNKIIANSGDSDIVMFCGHDDVFYPEKIEKCVEAFSINKKLALVYHDMEVVYTNGKKIKFSETQQPREKSATDYLLYGCFSTAPSVCVRNVLLQRVKFKKEVNRASDYLMMYEVAKQGEIKYINDVLGEYHRHDNNLSSKIKKLEDFDSIKVGLYVLENYPEDTFGALILLNRSLLKLFLKRKKYLLFYFISGAYTAIWHLISKAGRKII